MKSDTLLSELTALSYDARFRRLQELGRESRANPKLVAIFDAWETGDWQERLFAVQACAGSGNADRLAHGRRRFRDDFWFARANAFRSWRRSCNRCRLAQLDQASPARLLVAFAIA